MIVPNSLNSKGESLHYVLTIRYNITFKVYKVKIRWIYPGKEHMISLYYVKSKII